LRSGLTTQKEKQTIRHSGMDCRNPGSKDEPEDIHVGLDYSIPFCNDAIENFCIDQPSPVRPTFSKEQFHE
jgi:hypothetical protein